MERVDVLLFGAGASIEAGLPGTYELTSQIIDAVARDKGAVAEGRALQFVAAALLYAQGLAGHNPVTAGVDVEALYRGLDRLHRRSEIDVAPFVASWHPAVAEIESLAGVHPSLDNAFHGAKIRIEQELLALLWRNDLRISYLEPLKRAIERQRALTILTLNYDNVVETFCQRAGIPCSTGVAENCGFSDCAPYELEWVSEGVNLVKIHGSLLWGRFPRPVEGGPDREFVMSYAGNPPNYIGSPYIRPGIVFGGDNKLSPLHPFPDLYSAFRARLRDATRLTVVGYSFRDEHVNAEIATFMRREPLRTMVVVNRAERATVRFLGSFDPSVQERITYNRQTASTGLQQAFTD